MNSVCQDLEILRRRSIKIGHGKCMFASTVFSVITKNVIKSVSGKDAVSEILILDTNDVSRIIEILEVIHEEI